MRITLFENVNNTTPIGYMDFEDLLPKMLEDEAKKAAAEMAALYRSNKAAYDARKRKMPAFAIGEHSARNSNSCTMLEQYMGLDVDHVPPEKMREVFDKIAAWEYCWCVFPSVSELGFRVIVPVECTIGTRKPMYGLLVQMFSAYSGIPIDLELPNEDRKSSFCINASTSDICRLWFYAGARVHHFNPSAKKISQPIQLAPVNTPSQVRTLRESDELMVAIIVSEAERRRIDLTVGYQAWIDVGLSLASLGESGRVPFHRLSAISPQYKEKLAEAKYNDLVKNASGRKTIRTLAKIAKDAGILYKESPLWNSVPEESRVNSVKLQSSAPEDTDDGFDEVKKESIRDRLKKVSFKYGQKPKDIDFILKANVDGKLFDIGGFGMIGLITGLEKSRKTTLLRAITSSAISGGSKKINFQMDLKGKKAIYVDTEQPDFFFYNGQMQAHMLAGLGDAAENYEAYSLRSFSPDERIEAVDDLIDENDNLGLLILDGALDFVKNFNSEEQSQAFVQKMMQWTDKSGAMILAVIHVAKSSGATTGHLGSMLNKKCDFAFEMKNDPDTGFTTVSSKLSRTRPFTSFDFTQDDNGLPVLNHNEAYIVRNGVAIPKSEAVFYKDEPITDNPESDPLAEPFVPQKVLTVPSKMNDDEDVPF